MLPVALLGICG